MVIAIAESMEPCVLWIDEIEKALSTGGEYDGGVSKRVLATVQRIFNPRRIWLGGGHAQDLTERMALPAGVHVVSNDAGLWGGLWLWR